MNFIDKLRNDIANTVRRLRLSRQWSQSELAEKLGISQSRLSQLERGSGSFSAEHLLVLSQLFNVPPTDFTTAISTDEKAALQNALARFGATHLRESDDIPLQLSLADVVRETLVSGDSRFITALAPVFVEHIDELNLARLRARFAEAGLERRLGWLVENILTALRKVLEGSADRESRRRYRRATTVLELELEASLVNADPKALDILDPQIRSTKTREQVRMGASEQSRRWGVITRLHPKDFVRALEMASGA